MGLTDRSTLSLVRKKINVVAYLGSYLEVLGKNSCRRMALPQHPVDLACIKVSHTGKSLDSGLSERW